MLQGRAEPLLGLAGGCCSPGPGTAAGWRVQPSKDTVAPNHSLRKELWAPQCVPPFSLCPAGVLPTICQLGWVGMGLLQDLPFPGARLCWLSPGASPRTGTCPVESPWFGSFCRDRGSSRSSSAGSAQRFFPITLPLASPCSLRARADPCVSLSLSLCCCHLRSSGCRTPLDTRPSCPS